MGGAVHRLRVSSLDRHYSIPVHHQSEAPPPTPRIRPILAVFGDRLHERQYRAFTFSTDRHYACVGILLMAMLWPLLGYNDYLLFGFGPTFNRLMTLRIGILAFDLLILYLLLRRVKSGGYTCLMTVYWLGTIAASLFVYSHRPPEAQSHWLMMVILIFLLVPLPLLHQVALSTLASALTAANMYRLEYTETLFPIALLNLAMILTAGFLSNYLQRRRRSQFAAQWQPAPINADLLDKLKSVTGQGQVAPICSGCKKIRDEEGYWHPFELYLLEHREIGFTHGICPHCEQRIRSDLDHSGTP